MNTGYIDLTCPNCRTEIQASADMSGQSAECPACGHRITVPTPTEDTLLRHGPGDEDPDSIAAMKSRTIRIELGDI